MLPITINIITCLRNVWGLNLKFIPCHIFRNRVYIWNDICVCKRGLIFQVVLHSGFYSIFAIKFLLKSLLSYWNTFTSIIFINVWIQNAIILNVNTSLLLKIKWKISNWIILLSSIVKYQKKTYPHRLHCPVQNLQHKNMCRIHLSLSRLRLHHIYLGHSHTRLCRHIWSHSPSRNLLCIRTRNFQLSSHIPDHMDYWHNHQYLERKVKHKASVS